jgi:hypothetical protein
MARVQVTAWALMVAWAPVVAQAAMAVWAPVAARARLAGEGREKEARLFLAFPQEFQLRSAFSQLFQFVLKVEKDALMGWEVDDVLQGLQGARVVVRRKWSVLRLADLQ